MDRFFTQCWILSFKNIEENRKGLNFLSKSSEFFVQILRHFLVPWKDLKNRTFSQNRLWGAPKLSDRAEKPLDRSSWSVRLIWHTGQVDSVLTGLPRGHQKCAVFGGPPCMLLLSIRFQSNVIYPDFPLIFISIALDFFLESQKFRIRHWII